MSALSALFGGPMGGVAQRLRGRREAGGFVETPSDPARGGEAAENSGGQVGLVEDSIPSE